MTNNGEVRAIGKVAKILEEISLEDRTYVLTFLRGISGPLSAKAAGRIEAAIEPLDPPARVRVLKLFVEQVAEAYAREQKRDDGDDGRSVIRHADGSERAV